MRLVRIDAERQSKFAEFEHLPKPPQLDYCSEYELLDLKMECESESVVIDCSSENDCLNQTVNSCIQSLNDQAYETADSLYEEVNQCHDRDLDQSEVKIDSLRTSDLNVIFAHDHRYTKLHPTNTKVNQQA